MYIYMYIYIYICTHEAAWPSVCTYSMCTPLQVSVHLAQSIPYRQVSVHSYPFHVYTSIQVSV